MGCGNDDNDDDSEYEDAGDHDYFDTTNWIRIQADIINSHNEHSLLM